MVVEIGSLVVRGSFGTAPAKPDTTSDDLREEAQLMRQDILHEVRNMIAELERRRSDR